MPRQSPFDPRTRRTFLESRQVELYEAKENRKSFRDFYLSERETLDLVLPKVRTVTDIGCMNGDTLAAIQQEYPAVKALGIDIDEAALRRARGRFPEIEFLHADFLDETFSAPKSDLVIAFNLFDLFEDWRTALVNLKRFSSRYLNIGSLLRLDGPTVADPSVSFVYYGQGPERMVWAVHNIYELSAFCATEHINAVRIYVFCYSKYDAHRLNNLVRAANVVHPMPLDRILCGNVIIEFDDQNGMQKTKMRPDLTVVQNNVTIFDSPWKA